MTTVRSRIPLTELESIARNQFGDMVKAVVDVERGMMSVGGELHSDEEAQLLEDGSRQQQLWGANFYPGISADDWVEFDSVINIRPSQCNGSRGIDNQDTRKAVLAVVNRLVAR